MGGETIPVIDLKSQGISEKLRRASEDWGCFRIINHNISQKLMSDMKSVIISLFDLPIEIKRRNSDVIEGSGYVEPGLANPLYEAFGLYDLASPQAVELFCTQLDSSPLQRETIETYSKELHELAMDIGRKLVESMGLRSDFLEEWPCQFRINRYKFTTETVGSSGVQTHTDSGFLTILQDDENVGGLEVKDKSGTYVAVDPLPGSFLVNLGDIAQIWSNGSLYNVKHRVQCKEATTRVSIALFVLGPRGDVAVEAPLELVNSQNPRLYDPISYEDYRKLRLSTKMRAGEALELLAKN